MPIVVIVIGEGGSGGALGLAVGDRVLMHEFAVYSVIPPEGCAAILWRDAGRKVEAAEAMKITAPGPARAATSSTRSSPSRSAAPTRIRTRPRPPSIGRCGAALAEVGRARRADAAATRYERFRRLGALGERSSTRRRRRRGPRRPPARRDGRSCSLCRRRWEPVVWADADARGGPTSATATRRGAGGALDVPPVVARLLCQRGIDTAEAAARFLSPSLEHLHDPFLLTGIGVAVERLLAAVARASASPSTATTTSTASPRR